MHNLDLKAVAKSFGFATPPRVNLQLGSSMKGGKTEGRRAYGSQPKQRGGRFGQSAGRR